MEDNFFINSPMGPHDVCFILNLSGKNNEILIETKIMIDSNICDNMVDSWEYKFRTTVSAFMTSNDIPIIRKMLYHIHKMFYIKEIIKGTSYMTPLFFVQMDIINEILEFAGEYQKLLNS